VNELRIASSFPPDFKFHAPDHGERFTCQVGWRFAQKRRHFFAVFMFLDRIIAEFPSTGKANIFGLV
jgi:hypothetical protein